MASRKKIEDRFSMITLVRKRDDGLQETYVFDMRNPNDFAFMQQLHDFYEAHFTAQYAYENYPLKPHDDPLGIGYEARAIMEEQITGEVEDDAIQAVLEKLRAKEKDELETAGR